MKNKIYDIFQKDYGYINTDWSTKFRNETIRHLQNNKIINKDVTELEKLRSIVNPSPITPKGYLPAETLNEQLHLEVSIWKIVIL